MLSSGLYSVVGLGDVVKVEVGESVGWGEGSVVLVAVGLGDVTSVGVGEAVALGKGSGVSGCIAGPTSVGGASGVEVESAVQAVNTSATAGSRMALGHRKLAKRELNMPLVICTSSER